ncbi:MAG: hypothetical protein JWL77_3511 [Chthonomonadaceae bacterium]|nr:hypothetical protein [Chthonomonadaceae bacterium]
MTPIRNRVRMPRYQQATAAEQTTQDNALYRAAEEHGRYAATQDHALYSAAMNCGLVAVIAHQMGIDPGESEIWMEDDGMAVYSSGLISWVMDEINGVEGMEDVEAEDMPDFALLLCAGGGSSADECRTVGLEIARRTCPYPEALSTLEGHWLHRQVVQRWYADLTVQVLAFDQDHREEIGAVAAILMDDGLISGEDAYAVINMHQADRAA